jgi:RNA polymerase sigma-70 factor, ECF subfamily
MTQMSLVASVAGVEPAEESTSRLTASESSETDSVEKSGVAVSAFDSPSSSGPPETALRVRGSRESFAQPSPDIEAQITQLIEQKEDRAAVELMMREYKNAVYSLVYRILNDPNAARDALQQTFYEALRDLSRFRARSSVKTWLLGIANHRALDLVRRNSREGRFVSAGEEAESIAETTSPEVPSALDARRREAALEDCLRHLTPQTRSALLARYQRGLSYEEMAAESGEKPGTLQARVTRALPALRRCLEGKGF